MQTHLRGVVIAADSPDLARLEAIVLQEDGFEVAVEVISGDTLECISAQRPSLVVLHLPPTFNGQAAPAIRLLDQLRAEPSTAGIAVLAVTSTQTTAVQAGASYNVRATLTIPFDIDELTARVQEALDQPPLQAAIPPEVASEGLLKDAARVLLLHARDVVLRWAQRLQQEEPWQSRPDLGLHSQLDSVPVLLEAVVAALRYGDGQVYFAEHPEAAQRVRAHTEERRTQGIPLRAVIHEYSLLRTALWQVLERRLPARAGTAELVRLQQVVNNALDLIIELTLPAYLGPSAEAAP